MSVMEKAKELLKDYKKTLEEFIESNQASNSKKISRLLKKGDFEEAMEVLSDSFSNLVTISNDWESHPNNIIGGRTPAEFFKEIEDNRHIVELFNEASEIIDTDLPLSFVDRMKAGGKEVQEGLLAMLQDVSLLDDVNQDISSQLSAIRYLGLVGTGNTTGPLLELMYKVHEDNDLVLEKISESLVNIGPACLDAVLEKLESSQCIGPVEEYLMGIVSKLGSNNKSDRIYRCLKNAFMKMENKAIGALFFAKYGDGRIIPALRGFVAKNLDTISRETYYEIKFAVEKLGGNMDDLFKEWDEDDEGYEICPDCGMHMSEHD
ncbi:MAG: hypothetical protein N2489_01515 [Clostridia bacterium]|nr:hypothetical protein [Clostridia bacterium]